jgi:hypothetical protein
MMTLEEERRAAEKWIAKHGVGSLPGQRSETGESSGRQHLNLGRLRDDEGGLPRKHREDISYDAYDGGAEMFEQDHPGARWLVGMGNEPTEGELVTRSQVHHVLSMMLPDQVALLYERYLEDGGSSLAQMGAAHGVSKQAMHKRVTRATRAFRELWEAHKDDDITWEV